MPRSGQWGTLVASKICSFLCPVAKAHGKDPKSTPVLYNGNLYTWGITGILSCFDAKTGGRKWQQEFSKQFPKTALLFGTAMSPLVEDGLLIAHVGGHNVGALTAFDAETGDVRWRWNEDEPGYASPIVVGLQGARQIVTQAQNGLIGLSAATGGLLWRIPFTTAYDQNIVTPVVYKLGSQCSNLLRYQEGDDGNRSHQTRR